MVTETNLRTLGRPQSIDRYSVSSIAELLLLLTLVGLNLDGARRSELHQAADENTCNPDQHQDFIDM